jgi:hypothetical protein
MSPRSADVVVVFRVFTGADGGDVIALMPHVKGDVFGRYCQSYQHIGQHGSADYAGCILRSRPATPAEYAPLLAELESIGYGVLVRVRAGRRVSRDTTTN